MAYNAKTQGSITANLVFNFDFKGNSNRSNDREFAKGVIKYSDRLKKKFNVPGVILFSYFHSKDVARINRWNRQGTTSKHGNPHIPARNWLKAHGKTYKGMRLRHGIGKVRANALLEEFAKYHVNNKQAITNLAEVLAEDIMNDTKEVYLRQTQNFASTIPNAPSTISSKGFNRPLYRTGRTVNDIRGGYTLNTRDSQ
ncbi:MAG: hypothetical protein FWE37_05115 [Spirochaetaceae bacterium]|nr:hypothetical protein [Spirochaetaceae bacterium]